MKNIEFNFVVSGVSENKGPFEEKGEGFMKVNLDSLKVEGMLHAEMVKDALDTFIEVTQPSKNYEGISQLTVSVKDIVEL
jgi:hypothetical protein